MVNMDVFAPMPSPSVMMATRVNPGVRSRDWIGQRRVVMASAPDRFIAAIGPGPRAGPITRRDIALRGGRGFRGGRGASARGTPRPKNGHSPYDRAHDRGGPP